MTLGLKTRYDRVINTWDTIHTTGRMTQSPTPPEVSR